MSNRPITELPPLNQAQEEAYWRYKAEEEFRASQQRTLWERQNRDWMNGTGPNSFDATPSGQLQNQMENRFPGFLPTVRGTSGYPVNGMTPPGEWYTGEQLQTIQQAQTQALQGVMNQVMPNNPAAMIPQAYLQARDMVDPNSPDGLNDAGRDFIAQTVFVPYGMYRAYEDVRSWDQQANEDWAAGNYGSWAWDKGAGALAVLGLIPGFRKRPSFRARPEGEGYPTIDRGFPRSTANFQDMATSNPTFYSESQRILTQEPKIGNNPRPLQAWLSQLKRFGATDEEVRWAATKASEMGVGPNAVLTRDQMAQLQMASVPDIRVETMRPTEWKDDRKAGLPTGPFQDQNYPVENTASDYGDIPYGDMFTRNKQNEPYEEGIRYLTLRTYSGKKPQLQKGSHSGFPGNTLIQIPVRDTVGPSNTKALEILEMQSNPIAEANKNPQPGQMPPFSGGSDSRWTKPAIKATLSEAARNNYDMVVLPSVDELTNRYGEEGRFPRGLYSNTVPGSAEAVAREMGLPIQEIEIPGSAPPKPTWAGSTKLVPWITQSVPQRAVRRQLLQNIIENADEVEDWGDLIARLHEDVRFWQSRNNPLELAQAQWKLQVVTQVLSTETTLAKYNKRQVRNPSLLFDDFDEDIEAWSMAQPRRARAILLTPESRQRILQKGFRLSQLPQNQQTQYG